MMKKKYIYFLIFIIAILIFAVSVNSFAGFDFRENSYMYGTRAFSMGGAFTALADDATAAYWNPAGLTRSGAAGLKISYGSESDKFLDENFLEDVINLFIVEYNEDFKVDEIEYLMEKYNFDYQELDLMLNLNLGNYAVSFLGTQSIQTETENTWTNKLSSEVILSASEYIREGTAAIGINIKGILHSYNDIRFNSQYRAKGLGYSYDIGGIFALNEWMRLGIMVRNFDSSLEWEWQDDGDYGGNQDKAKLKESLKLCATVGTAIDLPLESLVAVDWNIDEDLESKVRIGFENSFFNLLSLRSGFYNQGEQWIQTYGIGFDLFMAEIDYGFDSDMKFHKVSAQIAF